MISFVICTFNREKYIYRTLQLLAENHPDSSAWEIVLVDNNSTDRTAELCAQFELVYGDKVQYRYFLENKQGLSNARNRGIEEARGEWIVFLDDDAFVQTGYVAHLLQHVDQQPEMVAFGGKIDPLYESGREPDWMSAWGYSWVSAIDLGEKVKPFEGKQYPIGANMGVRADVARRVGGFNPNLGRSGKNTMGGEEKDFFNKIKMLPSSLILYLPDVQVQHCIPDSRTTHEFIARLGDGVGASERQRTLDLSRTTYVSRLFAELIKWGGTLALWCIFLLKGTPAKGRMLVLFRYHVTKHLL